MKVRFLSFYEHEVFNKHSPGVLCIHHNLAKVQCSVAKLAKVVQVLLRYLRDLHYHLTCIHIEFQQDLFVVLCFCLFLWFCSGKDSKLPCTSERSDN